MRTGLTLRTSEDASAETGRRSVGPVALTYFALLAWTCACWIAWTRIAVEILQVEYAMLGGLDQVRDGSISLIGWAAISAVATTWAIVAIPVILFGQLLHNSMVRR